MSIAIGCAWTGFSKRIEIGAGLIAFIAAAHSLNVVAPWRGS
jgi:hypothetical protein